MAMTHFPMIPLPTLYHNFGLLFHDLSPTSISDKTALLLSFLRITDEFGIDSSIPDVYDETDTLQELQRAYNFFIMDETYALTPKDILRDVLFRCAEMSEQLGPTLKLFQLQHYTSLLFKHVDSRHSIKLYIQLIITSLSPDDIERVGSNLMSALSYHLNDGRIHKHTLSIP
jgi:hypothetical protein